MYYCLIKTPSMAVLPDILKLLQGHVAAYALTALSGTCNVIFSKKTPLNAVASVFGTFTALQYTSVRLTQFLKALIEIVLTVLGMVILASLLHPSKAEPPMDCKPSFKVTDVR